MAPVKFGSLHDHDGSPLVSCVPAGGALVLQGGALVMSGQFHNVSKLRSSVHEFSALPNSCEQTPGQRQPPESKPGLSPANSGMPPGN
jgi:hypothetical protein